MADTYRPRPGRSTLSGCRRRFLRPSSLIGAAGLARLLPPERSPVRFSTSGNVEVVLPPRTTLLLLRISASAMEAPAATLFDDGNTEGPQQRTLSLEGLKEAGDEEEQEDVFTFDDPTVDFEEEDEEERGFEEDDDEE